MGITQFLSGKMMATDKQNKALVYVMPIFMTYIFFQLPSGLVLYWLTLMCSRSESRCGRSAGQRWRRHLMRKGEGCMERFEQTGKSVDDALRAVGERIGRPLREDEYRVVDTGSRGVLGLIGAKPAVLEVWLREPGAAVEGRCAAC